MNVKLVVYYEEFPEDDIKVISVVKDGEVVTMLHGEAAAQLYRVLTHLETAEAYFGNSHKQVKREEKQ